jgi:hypothetical protein
MIGEVRGLVGRLRDRDLAERYAALEQLQTALAAGPGEGETKRAWEACVQDAAAAAVRCLQNERDAKFPIWRLVVLLGPCTVGPLEEMLVADPDPGNRVLAAAGLLRYGREAGVDILLEAIANRSEWMFVAARSVSEHGVDAAVPLIEAALAETPITESEKVTALVEALVRMGRDVPREAWLRMQEVEPAWLRESLLAMGRPSME